MPPPPPSQNLFAPPSLAAPQVSAEPQNSGIARSSTRKSKQIVAATAAGASPGVWMLWQEQGTNAGKQSAVRDVPFYAEWLRGRPRSLGSVEMPQFFDTVLGPGLLLVSAGVLVALAGLACFVATLVVRRRPQWIALTVAGLGAAAIVGAAMLVHSKDEAAGKAFAERTGTEFDQLVGSCWFQRWEGDRVPELSSLRESLTATTSDGTLVIACIYDNWAGWEREQLSLPTNGGGPGSLTAFFGYIAGDFQLLGAIDTPYGSVDTFTIDNNRVVRLNIHITGGPDFGTGGERTYCERQLDPDRVPEPCSDE